MATALPWTRGMASFDIDTYLARSGAVDMWAVDWAGVPKHSLPPGAIRTIRYMQDIESHTIVYLRSLLATRAIDDPDVATFLACWVHEETFHGLALERFLAAAGPPMGPRPQPHGHENFPQWRTGRRDGAPVAALAGLLRGAHDMGRDQRADGADRLSPAGSTSRASRAQRSPGAHPARRGAALLLLLPSGGDPAAEPRRGQSLALSGGSLLGPGGNRGSASGRAPFHGELSLRRRGRPRGGPQGRRDHPQAARLRLRATPGRLAGSIPRWRTEWRP